MHMSIMLSVLMLAFVCVSPASSHPNNPIVAWSFDKYNGTTLVPDFSSESKYVIDFSSLGEDLFKEGAVGRAIFIPGKRFNIAHDLKKDDCIYNFDSCNEVTVSFWLKLEKWGDGSRQSILKTLTSDRNLPGIYFGEGDPGNLVIYIRGTERKTYETTFSESNMWNKWTRLVIWWNKSHQTIQVFVNYTMILVDTYVGEAASPPQNIPVVNLVIGEDGGPTFLMDELEIYYKDNRTVEHHTTEDSEQSTNPITQTMSSRTMKFDASTTLSYQTTAYDPDSSTSTLVTPSNNLTYIAVAIIVLVPIILILLLFCARRRMKRRRGHNTQETVQLYEIDSEENEPYHDNEDSEADH